MTEQITTYAVTEIVKSIIQSSENIEVNREFQRTERAKIEAQKAVILEHLRGKHEENMLIIQASSQERIEMIQQIGKALAKDHLNENDKFFCEQLLKIIASGQQTAANSLSAPQQLLLN